MAKQLFQEKALSKLHRAERQDKLLRIVPPLGWLALATVAVVLFSVLIWSFFGVMADKVTGYGMLLNGEGAAVITSLNGGRIAKMNFSDGAVVHKGDVVAILEQPEMRQQLFYQLDRARDASGAKEGRDDLASLASLKEGIYSAENVVSPLDGVIRTQQCQEGDIVKPGTVLYDIELDTGMDDLVGVIFVPALQAEKIKEGMTIQLSPGAVDESEYGSLVARVNYVSEAPVSRERIIYWVGNNEFASMVLQQSGGSVCEVRAELVQDESTYSGYLWTSINGPQEKMKAGMVCTGSAIVNRKAPVVKAFSRLANWLRSD